MAHVPQDDIVVLERCFVGGAHPGGLEADSAGFFLTHQERRLSFYRAVHCAVMATSICEYLRSSEAGTVPSQLPPQLSMLFRLISQ